MELATRNRFTWRRQILTPTGWKQLAARLNRGKKHKLIIKNERLPGRSIMLYSRPTSKLGSFGPYRQITVVIGQGKIAS